ncbi:MAG: hypothetical protein PHQ28_00500 [Mycobacterium sp.]|nr:hypothetical protein [Mycobacterium sp.]
MNTAGDGDRGEQLNAELRGGDQGLGTLHRINGVELGQQDSLGGFAECDSTWGEPLGQFAGHVTDAMPGLNLRLESLGQGCGVVVGVGVGLLLSGARRRRLSFDARRDRSERVVVHLVPVGADQLVRIGWALKQSSVGGTHRGPIA